MKMSEYVKYFLKKNNNDIVTAKKRMANAAFISLEEEDMDSFEMESEAYQRLEVIENKLNKAS